MNKLFQMSLEICNMRIICEITYNILDTKMYLQDK